MKPAWFAVALLCTTPVIAQEQPTREQLVARFCHSSEVTSAPAVDAEKRIRAHLVPALGAVDGAQHCIQLAITEQNVINAYTTGIDDHFVHLPSRSDGKVHGF